MVFHKYIFVYFFMSFLTLSCGKSNDGDFSNIKMTIPPEADYEKTQFLQNTSISLAENTESSDITAPYAPVDAKGFDCIFVNVIGNGIGEWDAKKSDIGTDKKISYIGTYSKLVPVQTGGTIEIKVMKGTERVIQLVGVKSKVGCPDNISKDDLSSTDKFPGLFIVGSIAKDISKAEEIEINSSYSQKAASDFRGTKDKPWPAADKTAPSPGDKGALSGTSTVDSMTISWKAASDDGSPQDQLSYKLVSAKSFSDLKTVADVEKGTIVMDWTRKVTSKTITGLSPNKLINFGLLVKDVSENKEIYKPVWISTLSAFYQQSSATPVSSVYSISYDANGATAGRAPVDIKSYPVGSNVRLLTNTGGLVKTGYVFSGWNTLANGTGTDYSENSPLVMSAGDLTIYAKWTPVIAPPTYTIVYDGNGATGGAIPIDNQTYITGANVTALANSGLLVKTGFVFSGWNILANGSGTNYAENSILVMASANITLYAKWIAVAPSTYSITYSPNGATGGSVPLDESSYLNGASVSVLGNTGALVKTGYSFSGWNTSSNGTGTDYAVSSTYNMGASNAILYAKWSVLTYNVTYNGNGSNSGSVPVDNSSYVSGASVSVLDNTGNLTKTNSVFLGWNTDASGTGTSYAVNQSFSIDANTILYAVWASYTYYVSTTGDDTTGIGTAGSPFATIAKALDSAKASPLTGQFLINVASGTYPVSSRLDLYTEGKSFAFYGGYNSSFSSRDINLNETIIEDTRAGTNNKEIFYFSGNGITTEFVIEGFTINCGAVQGSPVPTSYNPIFFSGGKLVTVSKNKINIDYAYSSSAIMFNMYPNRFESNQVWKFTNNLISMKNTSGNSTIMKGIDTPNYYSTTNLTVQIYNNVFYVPDRGTTPSNNNNLISFSLTMAGNNFFIRNNTFVFKGAVGDDEYKSALFFGNSVSMVSLENNIFYSLSGTGAVIGVDSGDFTSLKNNSIYFSGHGDGSGGVYLKITAQIVTVNTINDFNSRPNSSSNQYIDPSFVNLNADWDLQPSSPIKNDGEDGAALSWDFTTDINGTTRTGNGTTGWSIGAYEIN